MIYTSQIASGTLTLDTDAGTFSISGVVGASPTPPDPTPPPTSGDAIDLTAAVVTADSPDVRHWPIGSKLTYLKIPPAVVDGPPDVTNMDVNFTKRNGPSAWPIVMGGEGEIQYTLWCGCQILGVWYLSGVILCISRGLDDNYVPTGPTLRIGQMPNNWYYFAGSPLAGHQPAPGEQVAWFLTAGVQRRTDIHTIVERTQVVLVPYQAGTWTF
jgi:hypothetical protein